MPPGLKIKIDNDYKEWPNRASSERSVFQGQSVNLSRGQQTSREQCAPTEFLAVPEIDVFHFAGCGQRKLKDEESDYYCCPKVQKSEYETDDFQKLETHIKACRNEQIECPSNEGIFTHYNNLNVNCLTSLRTENGGGDNQQNYIHFYSFTPIQYESRQPLSQILNNDSFKRDDLTEQEIGNLHIAELEIGFGEIHSALEQSLDKDQQKKLCESTHPFKSESPEFLRLEERLVTNREVKGNALPNEEEGFEWGDYRLYNIDRGVWRAEQLEAVPAAVLPDSHPGNFDE